MTTRYGDEQQRQYTPQEFTTMYGKINEITRRMGEGTVSYAEGLALVQELLSDAGDYIDSNAAAKSHLSSAGFNSQADVGKAKVEPIVGAPPPPPLDINNQGNVVSRTGPLPEEDFLFGAYQRGLASAGFNAGLGGGEFGNYLQRRFAPTSATFMANQALTGGRPLGTLEGENAFEEYARQTRGGNLGLQAQNQFQRLINRGRGGGDPNLLPEGDLMRNFLLPRSSEDYEDALALAREASRGRLGGYAASRIQPTNAELLRQFRGSAIGSQNQDFLAYLQRAFGLQ